MKKLNLGSGPIPLKGYLNVDIQKVKGVDKVMDLNKKRWNFKDNEFDEVNAQFIIEHVDNITNFMREIYRISKPNAIVKIVTSHFSHFTGHTDFEHKRPGLSYFSFGEKWVNSEFYNKFQIIKKGFEFNRINYRFMNPIFNPIINLSPEIYERFLCWILPCSVVYFIMRVKK